MLSVPTDSAEEPKIPSFHSSIRYDTLFKMDGQTMHKPVEDLEPGLKVGKDVSLRGVILVKAGTILTDQIIRRMKRWGIKNVEIEKPDLKPGGDSRQPARATPERIHQVENMFNNHPESPEMELLKNAILSYLRAENHD